MRVSTLLEEGGRVDWSPDGTRIAYDAVAANGRYALWTMAPDGSDRQCLTCDLGSATLPRGHHGNPAWHPSGLYLVFQAERSGHGGRLLSDPALGHMNDLWLLDLQQEDAYRLTDPRSGGGVLNPHFSSDGNRLSWSQMFRRPLLVARGERGFWRLMVAEFSIDRSGPQLSNIRSYQPGRPAFYGKK